MNAFRLLAVLIPLFTSGGGRGVASAVAPWVPDYYVSATGSDLADGLTPATAWTLPGALGGLGGLVTANTKVEALDGSYAGAHFQSSLVGLNGAPITFRAQNWGKAIIEVGDNSAATHLFDLTSTSQHNWIWGFQFRNVSSTIRTSAQAGSTPTDIANRWAKVVANAGAHNKFIFCIFHNLGDGPTDQAVATAFDSEWADIISALGGWDSPDRGHGHPFYWQNELDYKYAIRCFGFGYFSLGFKFSGSATSKNQKLVLRESALFDNYVRATVADDPYEFHQDQLAGATNGLIGDTLIEDTTFYKSTRGQAVLGFNYSNYGGNPAYQAKPFSMRRCVVNNQVVIGPSSRLELTDNTHAGNDPAGSPFKRVIIIQLATGDVYSNHLVDRGSYFAPNDGTNLPFQVYVDGVATVTGTFATYKTITGWDANGMATFALAPSTPQIVCHESTYEPGCGWIKCHNWGPSEVTGVAATDILTKTAHGLTDGMQRALAHLNGGTGLSNNTPYYIISATANTFQLSLTEGGAAIDFTTDITEVTVVAANLSITPEHFAQLGLSTGDDFDLWHLYEVIDDPTSLDLGTPVVSGTYDGNPLTLPQTGYVPREPYGWTGVAGPNASPEFNVFVVRKTG